MTAQYTLLVSRVPSVVSTHKSKCPGWNGSCTSGSWHHSDSSWSCTSRNYQRGLLRRCWLCNKHCLSMEHTGRGKRKEGPLYGYCKLFQINLVSGSTLDEEKTQYTDLNLPAFHFLICSIVDVWEHVFSSPEDKVLPQGQALFCGVWRPYTCWACPQTKRWWRRSTARPRQPTWLCSREVLTNISGKVLTRQPVQSTSVKVVSLWYGWPENFNTQYFVHLIVDKVLYSTLWELSVKC